MSKKFIKECDLCQRVKSMSRVSEGKWEHVEANYPCDLATVDFYGPLPRSIGGVQYLFVVVDAFSKLVRLYPIKRATTRIVLKKLCDNYFSDVGKPTRILSDNGTQFTSPVWKNTLEKLGLKVIYSSIRHPQSNPTERIMRELGKLFRVYCSDQHTKWAKYIKTIEELLNVTTHCSTGYVPYELHYGEESKQKIKEIVNFPPSMKISHELKITLAKESLIKHFIERGKQQRGKSDIIYEVGDKVLLKVPHLSSQTDRVTHKFFHLFEGPFKIVKIKGNNAFVLADINDDSKIKGSYNRLSLRRYYQADNP